MYIYIYIIYRDEKLLEEAKVELALGMEQMSNDAELHYYRGIIAMGQKEYLEALEDLNKTIKYAEESLGIHYLTRGKCYAALNLMKEAEEDLSIAIKLEQTLVEVYLIRGRCGYLVGNSNQAFLDYQQLIMHRPKDPLMHVHAGNLLMATGSYEDAAKVLYIIYIIYYIYRHIQMQMN